jgi:hypothetical protein
MVAGGRRDGARGTSLLDVIVALAIAAGALVSLASMFVFGAREMKAGRTLSEATAIAQDIVETIGKRSFTTLYTSLGAGASAAVAETESDASGSPLAPWQADLARRLENGRASALLQALGDGTPPFGSASGIRLTVTVRWSEAGRARNVTLSTVRF